MAKRTAFSVSLTRLRQEINGGRRPYHGEAEVLRSEHRDTVHVGTINGPCKIYKFEEYQASEQKILEETEDPETIFYWREVYDHRKGVVKVRLIALSRRTTFSHHLSCE